MSTDRSRPWRIALSLAGSLWALLLLTPVSVAFSGSGSPAWQARLNRTPFYEALRDGLSAIGLHDDYVVFGAAAGLSFLAIGLALLPDANRTGWGARAMAWILLAGAVLTPLSYANHPVDAPLHGLWGAEAWVLILLGVCGLIAAVTTNGRTGVAWPVWMRIVAGLTIGAIALGVVVFGYWPHGPLIVLGIEVAVLVLGAPRPRENRPDRD